MFIMLRIVVGLGNQLKQTLAHIITPKVLIVVLLMYIIHIHVLYKDMVHRGDHYYILKDQSQFQALANEIQMEQRSDQTFLHYPNHQQIKVLHKAAKLLHREYGDGLIDLKDLSYHLNVLRTRVFPSTDVPRPTVCKNCFPFDFKTLIEPQGICDGKDDIDILMLITTTPKAIVERRVLRETWLTFTKNNTANTRYIFLFGGGHDEESQAILDNEHKVHKDIIQHSYKDAYYNLTQKVMMGYKWAIQSCPRAKFVLRTADDNFINIPDLVSLTWRNKEPWKRAQVGMIIRSLGLTRQRRYKWYISNNESPETTYPDYAIGTAFLYSMDSIIEIVNKAPDIPFFPIEDAYFGFLMREISMKVIHQKGFHIELMFERKSNIEDGQCFLKSMDWYTLHLVTPQLMAMVWEQCIQKQEVKYGLPPKKFNNWLLIRP